ncbi:MAG: zinc ABC transporter substrate-binding protein [Chloroflexi bacterium]|nr:zinc ABC transporter substrate-binding protein [Chloroflexota bacterium]
MKRRIDNDPRPVIPTVTATLLAVILVGFALTACAGDRGTVPGKTRVVTTFYPLQYFASRIGDARVEVKTLVKPGVEAHDFEPTATDLRSMSQADVFVYNGLGFEPWAERALKSIERPDLVVIEAGISEGDRTAHENEGGHREDPHVWLDPRLALDQAQRIRDGLKAADPAGAIVYDANASMLTKDLEGLDSRYASTIAGCRLRHFVTGHAAFGYMAHRYGLEQIEITGISQEEPDPAELARIVQAVRESQVRYVLAEPGASPRIAETLAREVNAAILVLDPLESRPVKTGADYLSVMNDNLDVLRKALDCNG